MKIIPIKTQQIIMYIPYINSLNLFLSLYNFNQLRAPFGGIPQILLVSLVSAVPLILLETLLSIFSPIAEGAIEYINAYLIPLFLSYGLIGYQKKLLGNEKSK